jgi:hypothetical protein
MLEESLKALDKQFARMYSSYGRPGIPPERLLKGLLLQILFTIRSEPRPHGTHPIQSSLPLVCGA